MWQQRETVKTFPWEEWQTRAIRQKYPSLQQVLSSWEMVPAYAAIEGSVCRVKDNSGRWWVLKRVATREQAEFIGRLLELLSPYQLTPEVIKTKYGDTIAYWFDGYYYLMPMIRGKECSNEKLADVSLGAERLALFHQYARDLSLPGASFTGMNDIRFRLQQCKTIGLLDVGGIGEENLRLELSDYIYTVHRRLANFPHGLGMKLAQNAKHHQTVCHRHFHCGQILKEHRSAWLVHWDDAAVGIQLLDLVDFCSKVLSKNKWQPEYYLAMLNGYQEILPLSEEERQLLEALLLFPTELERSLSRGRNSKGKKLEKLLQAAIELDKEKTDCFLLAKGEIPLETERHKGKWKSKAKEQKEQKEKKEKKKHKKHEKSKETAVSSAPEGKNVFTQPAATEPSASTTSVSKSPESTEPSASMKSMKSMESIESIESMETMETMTTLGAEGKTETGESESQKADSSAVLSETGTTLSEEGR